MIILPAQLSLMATTRDCVWLRKIQYLFAKMGSQNWSSLERDPILNEQQPRRKSRQVHDISTYANHYLLSSLFHIKQFYP